MPKRLKGQEQGRFLEKRRDTNVIVFQRKGFIKVLHWGNNSHIHFPTGKLGYLNI